MNEQVNYIVEIKDKFSAPFRKLGKGFENASKKAQRVKKDIGGIGSELESLVGIVGIGFLAKEFLSLGLSLEQTNIQFEVLTGSVEAAQGLIDELNQTAATTPFEQADLQKAAQTMLSFGVETENITSNLRMLGDISGGNSQKLQSLALVFGQIKSTGRLMGQDLLQLINQGFNPLQEISARTGIGMADLKKAMEKGLISFDDVMLAFQSATGEGGRFNNMLEKVSESGFGKISTITGNFKTTMAEVAVSFIDAMKPMLDIVIQMVDWMGRNKEVVLTVLAVLGPLAVGIATVVGAIKAWAVVQSLINVLMTANPIGIVIVAIAALTSGIIVAYNQFDKFRAFIDGLWGALKQFGSNIKKWVTNPMEQLKKTFKSTLEPFFLALEAVKQGDFIGAAKHLGKGLLNLTPIGVAGNMFDGVGDAFNENFDQSLKDSEERKKKDDKKTSKQEEKKRPPLPTDLANRIKEEETKKKSKTAKSGGFDVVGKGGGNVSLTINKLVETINITSAEQDINMVQEKIKLALLSALNDATTQIN